jgi:ATP-dependent Clp protease ATP-binding subunit ClpA
VAVFERFTEAARQCVVRAQEEARDLGHEWIGSEHLVLGVAGVEPELLGVEPAKLRAAVVEALGSSMKLVKGRIPFTPEAKSAIEHALGVAIARHDRHIGPTQLLLALLEQTRVQDLVRAGGAAPEEVLARLAPADAPAAGEDELPQDRADAELLQRIARRGGAVAAWLHERGIDEATIRERFGER